MKSNLLISSALIGLAIATTVGALFSVSAKLNRDETNARLDQKARDRYENNCIQFKSGNQPIAVHPDSKYRDASGRPFAPGTPICDSFGATAIIGSDGVSPTDLAVVGDWSKYRTEKDQRVFDFQKSYEQTYRNNNKGR